MQNLAVKFKGEEYRKDAQGGLRVRLKHPIKQEHEIYVVTSPLNMHVFPFTSMGIAHVLYRQKSLM